MTAASSLVRLQRRVTRRLRRMRHGPAREVTRIPGQRVIAILGMHRSGTSSLAGSLEEHGLFLGDADIAGKGQWNRKGNRESARLMRLHERLLRANGGSWDRPPERVAWSPDLTKRRGRFIRSRAARPLWGFKDPRTLLVIDGWLEALPELEMVGTVRDPVAVAESLRRRHGGEDLADWLALWFTYNERLLRLYRHKPFPIIDFDLPADEYQQRLESLAAQLGLEASPRREPFFEPSLRSAQELPTVDVPAPIEALHERLVAIAAEQRAAQQRSA
jgi:hypothetical protein